MCQYHFTAWPDHDVPKFATGLLGFIERVNSDHGEKKEPIAVHCRYRNVCPSFPLSLSISESISLT